MESVGLDVRVAGRHEAVQNGSQGVSDWTLERREGMRKSKMGVEESRIGR